MEKRIGNLDEYINESKLTDEFDKLTKSNNTLIDDDIMKSKGLDKKQKYDLLIMLANKGLLFNSDTFDASAKKDDVGVGDMTAADVEKKWK
jgi:hypothetical protein